jgi:hypothetical protein
MKSVSRRTEDSLVHTRLSQRIIFPLFFNPWNQLSDIIHNSCTHPIGASIPPMMFSSLYTVAKFIVPDWGDKVDSGIELWYRSASLAGRYGYGIGLSYRPAGLYRLADWYHNPMPKSTIFPSQGL